MPRHTHLHMPLVLKLILLPCFVFYRLSGGKRVHPVQAAPGEENLRHIVENRTVYIDALVANGTARMRQFVVLGAGFDTRCYASELRTLARFELDQSRTQDIKRAALRTARIDTANVCYVPVNFADADWTSALVAAGFDAVVPAVFLWEGVSPYLNERDVRATLAALKRVAAPDSVIVADFYAKRFMDSILSKLVLKISKEEFVFAFDFSNNACAVLDEFVRSEGLSLGKLHMMGAKTKAGTFMVVAEILI